MQISHKLSSLKFFFLNQSKNYNPSVNMVLWKKCRPARVVETGHTQVPRDLENSLNFYSGSYWGTP